MRTIEQNQEIPYSANLTDPKGKVVSGIMDIVNPLIIKPIVENTLVNAVTEYDTDFGDKLIRGVQEGYTRFIVASNHGRIIDAVFPIEEADHWRKVANEQLPADKQLKGYALILAASLHYGQQGPLRNKVYNGLSSTFAKRNIVPFLTVRPHDVKRYKMKPYWNPRQEQEDIIHAIKDGYSILIQPEGTTVGDTMNPFMLNALYGAIKTIESAGEKSMIIPVSKIGGDKIERKDKLPTLTALRTGLNFSRERVVRMHVSEPLKCDQGELGEYYAAGDKKGINNLIGKIIASHLPEAERGIYGDSNERVIFPGES